MQIDQSSGPGLQCPNCKQFIPVTLPMLLSGTLFCIGCGLELSVDQDKSKEGMEKVRALWQSMQDCKSKPEEALPGGIIETNIKRN